MLHQTALYGRHSANSTVLCNDRDCLGIHIWVGRPIEWHVQVVAPPICKTRGRVMVCVDVCVYVRVCICVCVCVSVRADVASAIRSSQRVGFVQIWTVRSGFFVLC